MKILYINHYAGSLKHGMEFRPFYMARSWTKEGHDVLIAASSESHVRAHKVVIQNSFELEEIEGVHYLWCKTSRYRGNGIGRVINIFYFIFRLFQKTNYFSKVFKPNVVIASSTYPLDIFPSWLIAKLSGAKLIYEVHDLWPLSPIELGKMSPINPFIILLQLAENFACHFSEKVICMLPKAIDHLIKHGMDKKKFVYIPNGIDLSEWINLDPNSLSPKGALLKMQVEDFKKNNVYTVAYLGAHGLANDLQNLLLAAKELEKNSLAHFFLVGSGPEKDSLKNKAKDLQLTNVSFIEALPKADIPIVTKMFDILYIGLQKQSLFRFGISPNKLMDYMAAGRPIINSIEAGNDPVQEAQCGYSISSENPKALAETILKISQLPKQNIIDMGKNAQLYVHENHDYSVLSKKFLQAMEEF